MRWFEGGALLHCRPLPLRLTLDFSAVNAVGYGTIDRDVQRRIQWAVTMQAAKMERQLPYLLRQHERLVN